MQVLGSLGAPLEHRLQGHCSQCLVGRVPTLDLSSTGQGSCRVLPGMPFPIAYLVRGLSFACHMVELPSGLSFHKDAMNPPGPRLLYLHCRDQLTMEGMGYGPA